MSQDVEEKARQLSDWLAEQMPIGANCDFAHGDGRHYDFSMHVPGRMREVSMFAIWRESSRSRERAQRERERAAERAELAPLRAGRLLVGVESDAPHRGLGIVDVAGENAR